MIGMALVGAASVMAATANASMRFIVEDGWTSDFSIQSATGDVPTGAAAQIRTLDTVATVDALVYGPAIVGSPGVSATTDDMLYVMGLPAQAFGRTLEIDVTAGSLDTLANGAIAVQQSTATARGWTVGDEVTFTAQDGTVLATAPVGAILETQLISEPIILPEGLFAQVVPPAQATINSLLINAAPGVTPAALRADLVEVALPYVVLSVLDAADFADQLSAQVNRMLAILYPLLGLSVVIAILGIINTLALSVIERTREIGLMRAVGLGRLQLAGIITIESVLTAVFGTTVGIAVGVAITAVMPAVFADSGMSTLAIPWTQLAAMLALAAVVGVLAAVWPASRAARLPVLDAVSSG